MSIANKIQILSSDIMILKLLFTHVNKYQLQTKILTIRDK